MRFYIYFVLRFFNLTLFLTLCGVMDLSSARAAGTWSSALPSPPDGVNNCILLSDGTVLGMNGNGGCVRLTPDIHGSYLNGTWSTLSSMNNGRLFFSSQLLTNGNVWVAGGEYGAGGSHSEIYDSMNNVWRQVPDPDPDPDFSDCISEILPGGNPFVTPVYTSTACLIYNVGSGSWQAAASCRASQDEASWVKLPNDNILTIDAFSQNSEHYIPSLNQWVADGNLPVQLFDPALGELGAGFLLPNGQAFFIGSLTNTAIYTPGASVSSAGTWTAGTNIPGGLGAPDAPAAMMVNGKILCCLGPSATYNGPCSFYEYDYTVDAFTQVGAPGGGSTYGNSAPFGTSMLDLPDGSVLFVGGQNSTSLYIYTPDGTPLAAGLPVINNITENTDGSYHLTGTGLNGISEGAAYGDDEQMNSNYPLVRMTNTVSGNVYYARTYNWNSTSVMTGGKVIATEFALPQNLPAGTYSLVTVANGNPSAPQLFTYAPPAVPAGLTATSGSNAFVNLKWNASAGATAYNVKRSAGSAGYFATVTTVATANYTDVGLTNGVTYYYEVAAVGSGGPSANSGSVSAMPVGPPPVPTVLTATSGLDAQVPLAWNPSFLATDYNLKRATVNNGPYTTIASLKATSYLDTGLSNGTTYYYVVSSVGTNGESANSAPVSATPVAPVLTTWYKADAIAGLANGSAVSAWLDSSGSNYVASQSTSSQRPSYVTAAINGLPVVHFNAANSQNLTFNRPVQDNFTIFCVFRSTQGLGSGTLFYQGAGLVNGEVAGVVNDFGACLFANGQICAGTGNPDTAVDSAAGFNDGNPHLLTFRRIKSTGEVDLYVDGIFTGTTTGGVNSLTAPAKLALGMVQTGINFFNGDLGEVKIYATAMSDTDRNLEEGNLIHKWGISLPPVATGLTATPLNAQVQLNWNIYSTATNYLVKRATVSGGPYTAIGSSIVTNYLDATAVNGTTYYYVVSAVTPYTTSGNSMEASATPVPPAVITWFKADAITGLANGVAVSSWTDSSGHGYAATQSTPGQRPIYLLNVMNGLPAVHFNSAASDSLGFNRSVQDDFTILCVFRSTQGLNSGTYYYQGAGLVNAEVAGVADDFGTCLFANGQISAGTGNPDISANSGPGYNDGNPHLMTFKRVKNSGEADLYLDGALAGTVTGSSNSLTAPSRIVLGAQQTGICFLNGDIAEVKIFPSALADVPRGIEENALECKYGISGNAATPATPGGLTGVWGDHSASLSWLGVSGAAGYEVFFSTNASGPFIPVAAGIRTNSYVHPQAVTGLTNYYEVAATYACTVSPLSAPVGVFLPKPVVGIASLGASGGISISWPSWAGDWNLYYATNLVPPVNWLSVTNPVVNTNNQLIVTVPVGSGTSFFRLLSP